MNRRGRGRKRARPWAGAAAAEEEEEAAAKRMANPAEPPGTVHFCPQCGQKVETSFNFCHHCGGKLPKQEEEPMQISPSLSLKGFNQEGQDDIFTTTWCPTKKKVEISLPEKERASTSVKQYSNQKSVATVFPKATGKAKPSSRSPKKDQSGSVNPLPQGEILVDLTSQQWRLVKPLSRSDYGMMYEAESASGACPRKQRYSLKLGAKDGRLFNEQNCLQRAAKKATVEKWKKQHSVPLLGIPNCIGFGLHGGHYRFLVFPDLGRSLQSILDDGASKLTEKATFQIAVRLLDVLEFIHENEYCQGDVTAENIYVNPADLAEKQSELPPSVDAKDLNQWIASCLQEQVTLADYCFAFRYCPGGKHVPQREGSRTPHEGTVEFISLDIHKGAAPSRRSDLESLGYCLVKWLCGVLPWSEELENPRVVAEKKERYKADVIKHPMLSFGWRAIPDALQRYLQQVMVLDYDEKPNYEDLRMLLRGPLDTMKASAYDSVDLRVVS